MSTDWNIHCVSCNETNHFDSASNMSRDMAALCRHASLIAALVPLFNDPGCEIELSLLGRQRIDPEWFAKHAGHQLVPIDEYGTLLTQCAEYVACVCGSPRRCTRDRAHDGDHDPTARIATNTELARVGG